MKHEIPAFSIEQVEAAKAKYGSKCLKVLDIYSDVDDIYNRIPLVASMSLGNTQFRQIQLNLGLANVASQKRPSGIFQVPSGFVLGSSNGTPANQLEKIYVLVKQYRWTVTVMDSSGGSGQEILAP